MVSNSRMGLSVRLVLLVLTLCCASGCKNPTSLADLKPRPSRVAYADTDVGFQKFIRDLIDAHIRDNGVQIRMHELLIPNDSSWSIEVFGPSDGPILDFQYRSQLRYQISRLYTYLPIYGRGQNRLVRTEYGEPGHLSPFVTNSELIPAAERPLRIYSASIATSEEGPWLKVGSFVYVQGNFRYLGALGIATDWQSFFAWYDKPFEP